MAGSRAAVAAELNALSGPGQPLNTDADHCTNTRYVSDIGRRHFRKNVVNSYLARNTPKVARLAIVTAGPPGAGKTTLLHAQVSNLADYRILDADIVKDYLLKQAITDGIYDHLLTRKLADGHGIAPRELAPLVHRESVALIDQMRKICVARGENVVIEGTLTWQGQGPQIFDELATSRYTAVEVFGVEIDRATAHEQALSRWWDGRQRWVNGTEPLGGRFMPPGFIDLCYAGTAQPVCSTNALNMIDLAQSGAIPHVRVRIFKRDPSGTTTQLSSTTTHSPIEELHAIGEMETIRKSRMRVECMRRRAGAPSTNCCRSHSSCRVGGTPHQFRGAGRARRHCRVLRDDRWQELSYSVRADRRGLALAMREPC
ncbi:zeta toxin family protein [Mycobacterium asiaticum]|uniref:zeta toxin family protein n=1 Tax=Mycobacterium asiaticum TaxID=1790 RepID=UPI0009BD9EAE|nr:zeta toxin family protein [Mycobacterium asiaticum]